MSDLKAFDQGYWENRWTEHQTGWDIGSASTPIKVYFDQRADFDSKILIPGCGNAWEGEYLMELGFTNVFLLDIAPSAVEHIKSRVTRFPETHILLGDFFELEDEFDCIVEQTFFCALDPSLRASYARKAHELLRKGGSLVGVLFDDQFGFDHPPFGGTKNEYLTYFESLFEIKHMERAYNSIEPRKDRELFINLKKH